MGVGRISHTNSSAMLGRTIRKLSPQWIETSDPLLTRKFVGTILEGDLTVEDQDDEVRKVRCLILP
jgi:hypothetical protein